MTNPEIEITKPEVITSIPEPQDNLPKGMLLKILTWLRETATDNLFNQPLEN